MADLTRVWMAGQILASQSDELQLLAAIDGIGSVAGAKALPRFHLDEDEQLSTPHDEIDLAAA